MPIPSTITIRFLFPILVGLSIGGRAWAAAPAFPDFTVDAAQTYIQATLGMMRTQALAGVEVQFLEARWESQLGHQDVAERLALQAAQREPARADIWLFLANLYLRQDRLDEAARSLRSLLAADAKMPAGYTRLGMVLDRLGDAAGARQAYATGIQLAPNDAELRLLFGRWWLDQGQAGEAIGHARKACELNPEFANAFYVLYQAQNRLGDQEAAQKSLQTFQQLQRKEKAALAAENQAYDNAQAMRSLAAGFHLEAAALLSRQQQPEPAAAHLRQAAAIAPQEPQSRELLLALLLQNGQFAAARTAAEELIALRPNQASYRVELARVLLQMKETPRAIAQLQRALELDPQRPEALGQLARCYLGTRQNPAEALSLCERLVTLQTNAVNYDLLAWATYVNGRTNEARAACLQAVKLEPTNTVYQERLRRLTPNR